MKNKLQELVELIESQEHDDLEPLRDDPRIDRKHNNGFERYSFGIGITASPVKKYGPEQIKALEAQMKAQGKL